jgi:hypothetical protein
VRLDMKRMVEIYIGALQLNSRGRHTGLCMMGLYIKTISLPMCVEIFENVNAKL